MVRTVLDAPPNVCATFNVTPTLLDQVLDLAEDPSRDRLYALCRKAPAAWTEADVHALRRDCFSVQRDTMLAPFLRYRALLAKHVANERFATSDLLDLVVWFHLAWSGPSLRRDPVVAALFAQGEAFSVAQRDALLDAHVALLREVIPCHRQAMETGRIELSSSAYYHPILPLLCQSEAAQEADPASSLPEVRFRFPEDAERQIQLGLDFHARLFGAPPAGNWPPEGAVSEAAVRLLGEHGVRWIATDEAMLVRSLPHRRREQAFRFGDVVIFFRDHALSDRIGFVYSRWEPATAARDLVARLEARAVELARQQVSDPVVTIALDGENAWEHFPGGGYDFLAALYAGLSASPMLALTTPSRWLDTHALDTATPLPRLASGTWVDGTFHTWMGDPVKDRAWTLLAHARQELAEHEPGARRDEAMTWMLRAEASDWFWWFGAGHSSPNDAEFDLLFRKYVGAVYRALGVATPPSLEVPVGPMTEEAPRLQPLRTGRPAITGEPLPFFKWANAGLLGLQQGSIHRFDPIVAGCAAIYDRERITLRLDTTRPAREELAAGRHFELELTAPATAARMRLDGSAPGESAIGRCVEVALPMPSGVRELRFVWRVFGSAEGEGEALELDRFPQVGDVALSLRPASLDVENWVT